MKKEIAKQEITHAESLDTAAALPNLNGMITHPAPLSIQYWGGETPGEYKDVYIFGIGLADVMSMETKELKPMECVFMVEITPEGEIIRWYSAAVKLVGDVKVAISRGDILTPLPGQSATGVRIVYEGKREMPNKHHMSVWKILKLIMPESA